MAVQVQGNSTKPPVNSVTPHDAAIVGCLVVESLRWLVAVGPLVYTPQLPLIEPWQLMCIDKLAKRATSGASTLTATARQERRSRSAPTCSRALRFPSSLRRRWCCDRQWLRCTHPHIMRNMGLACRRVGEDLERCAPAGAARRHRAPALQEHRSVDRSRSAKRISIWRMVCMATILAARPICHVPPQTQRPRTRATPRAPRAACCQGRLYNPVRPRQDN